jgi:hypothetical protein
MDGPWKGRRVMARPVFGEPPMSTRPPANLPPSLALARDQIRQWRSQQQGRKRLPWKLWQKAVTLARAYGVNKTARTLGLKYDSLRKHLEVAEPEAGDAARAAMSTGPDFIELLPATLAAPCRECTIEWAGPRGVTMRMHVKGITVADLVVLAGGLRRGRA